MANQDSWDSWFCSGFPLKECLLAGYAPKLVQKNRIVDILFTGWKAMASQLIPLLSPLASFLRHPLSQEAAALDNFSEWQKKNLEQFQKLGTGRRMYTGEIILQKNR